MNKYIVILDLNGVVVDVRHKEEIELSIRPDVILPNGQKAYLHPRAIGFLNWLSQSPADIVLYTSRLAKNAHPVENLIHRATNGNFRPILRLYGEDCLLNTHSIHPLKSIKIVQNKLKRYVNSQNFVFVDDHPERIVRGDAKIVVVKSYSIENLNTVPYLEEAAISLYNILTK